MKDCIVRAVEWPEIDGQWEQLVGESFHPAYSGIGEAYRGVEGLSGKLDQIAEDAQSADIRVWAALHEGRLLALMTANVVGDRLIIYDTFVAPDARRQGLGRRLVEQAAADTGARVLEAEVRRDNAASQALFEALGFQRRYTADWFVRGDEKPI